MTHDQLSSLSTNALVEQFAQICVAQDVALLGSKRAKFNILFQDMVLVAEELKAREGDQRRALLRLYDHPNMQVRVAAAKETLAVAPEHARAQLQAIADANWAIQSLDAGMCLWNLETGVFKPT